MGDSDTRPVAVDGAELFLGRAIVRELLLRGVPVRAVVAGRSARVRRGAEKVVSPLGDELALERAVDGARAVVVARKILQERPREGLTFRAVHAERTSAILRAAEAARVERLVYVGVAGIDRPGKGPLVEAERVAEAYLSMSKMPTLSLRASLVVGPGDGHVARAVRKARSRLPVILFVGQGWARSAPLTRGDFGRCVANLILAGKFRTQTASVGGPELLTAMDIHDRLLARAGRRKLKVHVPESVARLGALVLEKLLPRPPVTRTRLAWLLEDSVPDRVTSTEILGRRPRRIETAFPGLGEAAPAQGSSAGSPKNSR